MKVRVMSYEEREALKAAGGAQNVSEAWYHRFVESYCDEDDQGNRYFSDCLPLLATYRSWLSEFPGWSCGRMYPGRRGWKEEYRNRVMPMNVFYRNRGWKNRVIFF